VVARMWKGRVRAAEVEKYRAYVRETGLAEYRTTPGNLGAWMLTSVEGDEAQIITISLWESREAIVAFAGDDIRVARYYPEDERYLVAADPHATHYDVDVG
jgi:heme-degrading monooxygenase HmoA